MASGEPENSDTSKKNVTSPRDVDFGIQDPVLQQHELLISEIESSDGHLGSSLRYQILIGFDKCCPSPDVDDESFDRFFFYSDVRS